MQGVFHVQQLFRFGFGQLINWYASPRSDDLGNVFFGYDWRIFTALTRSASFGLSDRPDFRSQFHFAIAQFSCTVKVLGTHCIVFVFQYLTQFLIQFFGCWWQLRIHQPHPTSSFVYQVDRLIGQVAIADITVGQFGGCF